MPPEGTDEGAGATAPASGEGAAKPALLSGEAGNPGNPGNPADGSAAADARDWLPEEYRTDAVFKDIKDPAALAKSYRHTVALVGLDKAEVLRLPKDPAAPEWEEVYTRLGRPETPEKYEFPELPAPLLEGVEPAARAAFHKAGLSAQQGRAVMELYAGQVQAAETARLERAGQLEDAVVADLQREWGDAFDDKLHAANRAIAEAGGKALGKLLMETRMPDGTRMGNHPLLIKAFAAIGARIAEPADLKGSGGGGGPASYSPEEAQAQITALRGDKAFHEARRDPKHADHAKNTALWDRLNAAAAAGRAMVA